MRFTEKQNYNLVDVMVLNPENSQNLVHIVGVLFVQPFLMFIRNAYVHATYTRHASKIWSFDCDGELELP